MEHSLGTVLPLYYALPFVGMLLSIALAPVIVPKFWHHHFGKVAFAWAVIISVPLIIAYGGQGIYELLHIMIVDYIPFIILLGSLFVVGGGILLRTNLKATTTVNAAFLAVGSVLASWMGTTGAAMLLIRPFLRVNKNRKYKTFMVVFFIFMVANVGGSLTPLGDPPLFLGFLHGVPFFWTLKLITPMSVVLIILLLLYVAFDRYYLNKEIKEGFVPEEQPVIDSVTVEQSNLSEKQQDAVAMAAPNAAAVQAAPAKAIEVLGLINFVMLAGIIAVILFSGSVKMSEVSILGIHVGIQDIIRNIALIVIMILSMKLTPKAVREENEFTWAPIQEVAYLFFGIFMTMAPVLAILKAGEAGALSFITNAVKDPTHYFWIVGGLSSFLDNAPTYLTFFNTALGQFYPGMAEAPAVAKLIAEQPIYLMAISAGSVFFGAMTYIGNAPNFMVRSMSEEAGIKMPSFLGYIVYSACILLPIFALVNVIFFR